MSEPEHLVPPGGPAATLAGNGGVSPGALPLPAAGATVSFQDPEIYQAFVQSLFRSIDHRLSGAIEQNVATEIATLTRLLNIMPPTVVQQHRVLFELAFTLLAADQPNLTLVRGLRRDLSAINDSYVGGLSRVLLFLSGKTLLNAILLALLTIVAMSFVFMFAISGGIKLLCVAAVGSGAEQPLSDLLYGPGVHELMLMAHAAFLGSVVSIMWRMRSFLSDAGLTPLVMYVSVVTRPVVSVLIAVLAFCTMKSGLVSFHALELGGPGGGYVAWAVGFLCGFSERLAQDFLVGAGGALEPARPSGAAPAPRGAAG